MRLSIKFTGSLCLALVSLAACQSLEFDSTDGGDGGRSGNSTTPPYGATSTGSGPENDAFDEASSTDLGPLVGDSGNLFGDESRCANGGEGVSRSVRRSPASSLGTSSATWARAMLNAGRRPDPALLRVDDFLALYLPPPADEAGRVALHLRTLDDDPGSTGGGGADPGGSGGAGGEVKPEGGGGEGAGGEPPLTTGWDPIDVIARVDTPAERSAPLRIVLLVDVSPSMRAVAPLVDDVVDSFAYGLGGTDDALAVVSFAGDARVEVPLGRIADVAPAIEALELEPRPGSDLSAALEAAYALRTQGEPLHVVLLTDGAKRFDESLVAKVAGERVLGTQLSVALFGKPARAGVDPALALEFPRQFGETLARNGGGQAHYFTDATDVLDVLGDRGIDRRFGVAMRAGALSVTLGRFLRLEVAEGSTGDSSASTDLAPGWSYGFHVPGSVCSAETLRSSPELLLVEARVALEGEQLGEVLFEAAPSTGPEVALDAIDLVESAVVTAVGALRGADAQSSLERLDAVGEALGCPGDTEARGCRALEELRDLVVLHGSAAPSDP